MNKFKIDFGKRDFSKLIIYRQGSRKKKKRICRIWSAVILLGFIELPIIYYFISLTKSDISSIQKSHLYELYLLNSITTLTTRAGNRTELTNKPQTLENKFRKYERFRNRILNLLQFKTSNKSEISIPEPWSKYCSIIGHINFGPPQPPYIFIYKSPLVVIDPWKCGDLPISDVFLLVRTKPDAFAERSAVSNLSLTFNFSRLH